MKRSGGHKSRRMSQLFLREGVRIERVSTSGELEASLALLPNGVRFGIACDLGEHGHALRLDATTQCVYHLYWDRDDVVILTCGPTTTLLEATILLSSIKTLNGPLDPETAVRLYRRATSRGPEFPVEPRRHPRGTVPGPWIVERFRSVPRALQRLYRYLRRVALAAP
jgi:hypothetical protein